MVAYIPTQSWFEANNLLIDHGLPDGWASTMQQYYGKFVYGDVQRNGELHSHWCFLYGQYIPMEGLERW